MKKKFSFLTIFTLVVLVFFSYSSVLAKDDFPLGYPFSSWGEIRYGSSDVEDGLILDSYFEQGINWYQWNDFTFNTFLGLRLVQSTEDRDFWNNKYGPWLGFKIKHPLIFFPSAWGEFCVGIRGELYDYTSFLVDDSEIRAVYFGQWSFGGDWKNYNSPKKEVISSNNFPLGYPFSSWGELRYGSGDLESGLILDSYFEQGIDWWRWNNFTFNTFLGLRLVQSTESQEYWNNKLGPWLGFKIRFPFEIFPSSWGELNLGVRGEYYRYTTSYADQYLDDDQEISAVVFLQWSFGGDWKRINRAVTEQEREQERSEGRWGSTQ